MEVAVPGDVSFDCLVERLEIKASPDICIFKIQKDYCPEQAGLGIYHHNCSSLSVQKMKERALTDLCADDVNRDSLIQLVTNFLPAIKDCYMHSSEYFQGESQRDQAICFAKDACFIIQFFTADWIRPSHDMWMRVMTAEVFMFENQVPLFLLLKILKLKLKNGSMEDAADEFAKRLASCRRFQTLLPFAILPTQKIIDFMKRTLIQQGGNKRDHLFHLLNKCINYFLSPNTSNLSTAIGMTTPIMCHPHLERLHAYNIKFQARNNPARFEKRWIRSVLFLPQIFLDEVTELLHKNLINFARLKDQGKIIYDLTFLMKYILNENNEGLLRDSGIIQGHGTRFSETISRLCPGGTSDGGQFREIINELNEHCNSPLNRSFKSITEHYGKVLFVLLSILIPILLSILQLIFKK